MFPQNPSPMKCFHKNLFCGSLGISLSTSSHAGWDNTAYSWISPYPAKAGPTLRGGGGGGIVACW